MPVSLTATDLLNRQTLESPYAFYERLRNEAPVWQVPGTQIFIVSGYALLDEATKRTEDFSSNMTSVLYRKRNGEPGRLFRRQGILEVLATADPPVHGRHKAAVMPNFSPRRISELEGEIEQLAQDFILRALADGKTEFMSQLANPLPMEVVSSLVGFPEGHTDRLLRAAFDSTAIVSGSSSLFSLFWTIARTYWINRWIGGQLKAVSLEQATILGSLKRSINDGALKEIEGRAFLHVFLAAGGESTTSLLGSAVRILAGDKALQHRLRETPEQIPEFIEEVLRLESPFRYHLRSTPKATELGGIDIPAGATVLLFWGAGNRDPEVFENPESLDLTRPRRHMTFGRGIHMCIGAPLARLEAKTVFRILLERTSDISLDPDHPPKWVESLQVRRYHTLPLRLTSA